MSTLSAVGPSLVAIPILVALSAFFSSSESAIFSLPEEGSPEERDDQSPNSKALARLRADPHRLLVTLLVGNNLVNIALTSIITLLVTSVVPPALTVVAATLVSTVLVLMFGEIVPKSYGLGHAESWSLRVARPIGWIEWLLTPLILVFDTSTSWLAGLVGGDQEIEHAYESE